MVSVLGTAPASGGRCNLEPRQGSNRYLQSLSKNVKSYHTSHLGQVGAIWLRLIMTSVYTGVQSRPRQGKVKGKKVKGKSLPLPYPLPYPF